MKLITKSVVLGTSLLFCYPSVQAATLPEAIHYALETNPSMLVTTSDRQAIAQELNQAKAGYLPTLDLTAGYGREKVTSPTIGQAPNDTNTLNRTETGVALNQMLFDGLATPGEVARNKARVTSASYRIAGTAQDTALRVAEVYLEVLHRQDIVQIATQNLSRHQRIYDMIEKRAKSGVSSDADRVQAEARLALAKANLQSAVGNVKDAQANYLAAVGDLPQNLVAPVLRDPQFPTCLADAEQYARANHPLLKLAEADIAAAEAQHKVAYAPDLPRFDLQLSADNNHNVGGIQGPDNDYQAMVRMKYNLFKGGADLARQRQTAFLLQEAKEVRDRTLRQVDQSLDLSWDAYVTNRDLMPNLQRHYTDAQRTVELYRKQYQIDQRTLLDVLDSEAEAFDANQKLTDAKYNLLFSQYRVLNGMGRLLQDLFIPLPAGSA